MNTRKKTDTQSGTYAVQVNGMLSKRGVSGTTKRQKTCAHRSTKSQRRDCELNTFVRFEAVDAASGEEVRGILRPAQDLEQYRDIWGCEGFTINSEFARVLSMGESQVPTRERRAFTDE